MRDIELQINYIIDLAKKLLLEQNGEFFPLCTYVKDPETLVPFSIFNGNEQPSSNDLIDGFLSALEPKLANEEILSFVIAYDCRTKRNENSETVDAIAIDYYSKSKPFTTYFYPYQLTKEDIILHEPWGVIN